MLKICLPIEFLTRASSSTLKTFIRCASRNHASGNESESEKWRRIVSDSERSGSGYVSVFEDADGDILLPRGELSNATVMRSLKRRSTIERVRFINNIRRY